MAASQGKHAKPRDAGQRRGKHASNRPSHAAALSESTPKPARKRYAHAAAAEVHVEAVPQANTAMRMVVALAAIVALALVPFSVGHVLAGIGSQAMADSTRTAFPTLTDSGARQPAASFAQYFDIAEDEVEANEPEASPFPTQSAPQRYTDNVAAEYQNGVLSGGCELVSLDIALDAMGFNADLLDIVNNHLVIDGHFGTGYSGNPSDHGGGFPNGIVSAANSYLASRGEAVRAHNLTGAGFDQLADTVDKGYPVLVWTTMHYKQPAFANIFEAGLEWYTNEHCVVMYGMADGKVRVSDPLEGLVEVDASLFQSLYEQCGSMAVAVF